MLDTATAEIAVYNLLEDQATRTTDYHRAHRDYAKELVRIMVELIKSGDVTGRVVTTGSAATQTGPLSNGKIS